MNRKSSGLGLRKSIRPRETLGGSTSSGAPSASGKRGLSVNRNLAGDASRGSISNSRLSLYGQPNQQKDPRTLNDEFIQKTYGRIRTFFSQKGISANDVTLKGTKLTHRQFENLFLILFRCIEPTYNPPKGNMWIETEVPVLMEGLSYPHKVTKSMMQTVSSKPGPIVGLLDYLLDLATAIDCDPAKAIQYLAKDDSTLEVETEELARASFVKGLSQGCAELNEQVVQMCTRHKGIMDEPQIQAESERVMAAKLEAEASLQLLLQQVTETERINEECEELKRYLDQMRSRQASKEQDLARLTDEKDELARRLAEIDQLVEQTKRVVESQPIPMEKIRAMRKEIEELRDSREGLASKNHADDAELEVISSSKRVTSGELDAVCEETVRLLGTICVDGLEAMSRDRLANVVSDIRKADDLKQKITAVCNKLQDKMAKLRIIDAEQIFELNQRKQQLQTMVDYVKLDRDAVEEKLAYFSSRHAERLEELLSRRRLISAHENQILFIEKEVEDLKLELKRCESHKARAEAHLKQTCKEGAVALKALDILRDQIHRTISADNLRMQERTAAFREAFAALPLDNLLKAIHQKFDIGTQECLRKILQRNVTKRPQ